MVPVLRWSPNQRQEIEAVRDLVLQGVGTVEPLYEESLVHLFGRDCRTVNWRRPLRLDEIARLSPTRAVRDRPGRA